MSHDKVWWGLSFSADGLWTGLAIVRAERTLGHALSEARAQGCNPGGAVRGWEYALDAEIDPQFANRLLTLDEAKTFNELMTLKEKAL